MQSMKFWLQKTTLTGWEQRSRPRSSESRRSFLTLMIAKFVRKLGIRSTESKKVRERERVKNARGSGGVFIAEITNGYLPAANGYCFIING